MKTNQRKHENKLKQQVTHEEKHKVGESKRNEKIERIQNKVANVEERDKENQTDA